MYFQILRRNITRDVFWVAVRAGHYLYFETYVPCRAGKVCGPADRNEKPVLGGLLPQYIFERYPHRLAEFARDCNRCSVVVSGWLLVLCAHREHKMVAGADAQAMHARRVYELVQKFLGMLR